MKQKLITLKDKLNDLSKRNRSIRMLKLYDKWAFDLKNLANVDKDPVDIIKLVLEQKGNITLLKQDVNNEKTMNYSAKINNLYRNMKAIEEETGLYDLYMGYPYITGNMLDGSYVRAPLFLYPVRLEKEKAGGTKWTLVLENDEPQLNRTLFLALKKLSGIDFTEELFEEAVQESKTLDFLKWNTWLKKHSFNLLWSSKGELQSFIDYKQNEVPEFNNGQFQLENIAMLGNFPQGNSALLKDYEDLLEIDDSEDMGIMETLLGAEDTSIDEKEESEDRLVATSEAKKFLVLDADASQEEIINEIDNKNGLVIHGPPGTGKSQVIVNLIANIIAKNQKVLLVCQKRAALDVVYQRLDSIGLSKQVALLHDEKSDRKSLYSRIHSLLDDDSQFVNHENELLMLSNKIEQYENELNAIAKGLYEVQPNGYKAYELYGLGKPMTEVEVILDLENILNSLNKENFEDVLSKILSYGSYYGRFGNEQYPLKNRKSFTKLDLKDRLALIEILNKIVEKAEKSIEYLENFEQDEITPAYTWLISDKLEKIYEDLNPDEKKSLQKLRLWWWTSFTGKTIVEELLNGEKFKGTSSKEWPKLRESLRVLFELSKVSEKMSKEISSLKSYFNEDSILKLNNSISKGDIPVKDFRQKQEFIIQDFEELRLMDRTYDESLPFIKLIIDRLRDKTNDNVHNQLANEWVDNVKQSAYIHWIDEIENKHPALSKIGTEELENIRKEFSSLLKKKRELAAKVLMNRLLKWLHQSKQSNGKQFRELKHQVGKKRMVWPVRKLVRQFSLNGLLDAMPIWLTSPESVSAIFPLEKDLFDVVIFDEASQCTVENGIPSIYRGKKIIVAGDEKQLPPSNLFKGDTQIDEEGEEDEIEHSESLLNLSKRSLPEKMLQWHYRSKFEELINFSNHAYYNGNVQIAPNVSPLKDPAAIKWHKVMNGKWINQCNEAEAIEVVNLLKETVIKEPNKSVGIITFNAKQQDKILDIIESEVEKDKEFSVLYQQIMSKDLDERIFVKNIENVQGDERDTIIFSIAYARNEQGKVYSRFGTLSQQGGENRLNVAVSRAKEQIHVVSSIEPADLNVSNAKNDGPKLLKNYLEYSKAVSTVNKDEIEAIVSKINENHNTKKQDLSLWFDSPFEEQVYKQLIDLGYKVDTQVGMSGYRIDMAVVHPKDPHKYILGIECDGAMFHSAASAKERDVYRQQFLESKGWKITRIWSRNWWKNASVEIERVDQLIKQIVTGEESKEKVLQF